MLSTQGVKYPYPTYKKKKCLKTTIPAVQNKSNIFPVPSMAHKEVTLIQFQKALLI
jgi:hypothetical protein